MYEAVRRKCFQGTANVFLYRHLRVHGKGYKVFMRGFSGVVDFDTVLLIMYVFFIII